jgi:hypothetical protein
MLRAIGPVRGVPMRNLTFQISSQDETRPLRDLNAERFRFRPAIAVAADEQDYYSKVLVPRQRNSARKGFGLRLH